MARKRSLGRKTVGTHIQHTLNQLGVRTRAQAVALAYRDDLVKAGDDLAAGWPVP